MNRKQTNILIIGGGRIGQALSFALKQNKPIIWDIDPKKCTTDLSVEELAKKADIIFFGIPGFAHEQALHPIKSLLKKQTIVISVSKGINKQGKFVAEILNENLRQNNYGIIAGPIMAEEIIKNKPAVALLALKDNTQFLRIKKLFEKSKIRIINYTRPKDLSVAGVLKNIYALFLGIIDGLKLGENTKAYFLTKSLREMRILAKKFKANQSVINTIAGMGDLILTAYSQHSDNRQEGENIAQGKKPGISEGLNSLEIIGNKIKNKKKLSLLSILSDIIFKHYNVKQIKQTIQNLLPN